MRLSAMADEWNAQQKQPKVGALSFDERFAMVVDAEHMEAARAVRSAAAHRPSRESAQR